MTEDFIEALAAWLAAKYVRDEMLAFGSGSDAVRDAECESRKAVATKLELLIDSRINTSLKLQTLIKSKGIV